MIYKFVKGKEDYFYAFFRIFVGLMFMQHGVQKLFGMFGFQQPVQFFSLMWFAGIIELFGGLFVALGLFTRIGALLAALEMLAAYFITHAPNSFFPIVNMGELALLYFASFLIIFVYGARKCSLSQLIFKKEVL